MIIVIFYSLLKQVVCYEVIGLYALVSNLKILSIMGFIIVNIIVIIIFIINDFVVFIKRLKMNVMLIVVIVIAGVLKVGFLLWIEIVMNMVIRLVMFLNALILSGSGSRICFVLYGFYLQKYYQVEES